MKKGKITLSQSTITTVVRGKQEHEYTVIRLQNRTEPPIGTVLTLDRVRTLNGCQHTTVEILPAK